MENLSYVLYLLVSVNCIFFKTSKGFFVDVKKISKFEKRIHCWFIIEARLIRRD